MKSEISITARGFQIDCKTLTGFLFDNISMHGTAGEQYRNMPGKILKKSFVLNVIKIEPDKSVVSHISEIIESWGGVENIKKAKDKYKIESVHLEIHIDHSDEIGSIFIDKNTNKKISSCCDSIGLSWN